MKLFLGFSDVLQKKWIVKALNVDDASYKVIEFCKKDLENLQLRFANQDVDVDLRFKPLGDEDVVEI